MSAAANDDSAATFGGAAGMDEEVEMNEHTELLIRTKAHQARSSSALRQDPRPAGGGRAQDDEDGDRSVAAGGAGLGGRVMHVRIHTPPQAARVAGEDGNQDAAGSSLRAVRSRPRSP